MEIDLGLLVKAKTDLQASDKTHDWAVRLTLEVDARLKEVQQLLGLIGPENEISVVLQAHPIQFPLDKALAAQEQK